MRTSTRILTSFVHFLTESLSLSLIPTQNRVGIFKKIICKMQLIQWSLANLGGFPCGRVVKNLPANAEDLGIIPG